MWRLVAREGGEFRIPLAEHERALAVWKGGAAFFDTTDFYGGARTIKLATIESIAEWPPAALAALTEDAARGEGRGYDPGRHVSFPGAHRLRHGPVARPAGRRGRAVPALGELARLRGVPARCARVGSRPTWVSGRRRSARSSGRSATLATSERGERVMDVFTYRLVYSRAEHQPAPVKSYEERFPQEVRARKAVQRALARGELVRPHICSACGKEPPPGTVIESHHDDYMKPLEVEWLCKPCHGAADSRRELARKRKFGY